VDDQQRYEKGKKVFKDVMGFDPPEGKDADAFVRTTVTNLFGDVWSRDGLSRRDRRLITIVIVTFLGQTDYLKLHLTRALEAGELTASEVEEIMLHIAHYAGWPRGTLGSMTAREVIGSLPRRD
jgi:4-carboxymuconolactone decarboxylase